MGQTETIVPARFLVLTAHFVITLMLFWSKDINIYASIGIGASQEDYDSADKEFTAALAASMALFAVEYASLLRGVSLFNDSINVFTTVIHATGAIVLAFFILDEWVYTDY